jgi:hypothetical protein
MVMMSRAKFFGGKKEQATKGGLIDEEQGC